MKNKTTYYHIILDRSGSMESCRKETIEGFNAQVKKISEEIKKFPEQQFLVSLTIFNSQAEHRFLDQSIESLVPLSTKTYVPDGNTALLDAVGETLTHIKVSKLPKMKENEASTIVVVITDGFENASQEYNYAKVAKLINELRATDNFIISYLGASLESMQEAEKMNIHRKDRLHFSVNDIGKTFNRLSDASVSFINSKNLNMVQDSFLNEEEDN